MTVSTMHSDHVRIMCPALACRKILAVPVSSRGKNVRCKNCGATIRIPEKIVPIAAAPAAGGVDKKTDNKQQLRPAAAA